MPRGPARARRSIGKWVLALIVLLVAAALLYGAIAVFEPFHGAAGMPVRVEIPPGASVGDVGNRLSDAGVVDSGTVFSLRATLAGKRADLRSGSYALRRDMTYGAAIDALTAVPAAKQDDHGDDPRGTLAPGDRLDRKDRGRRWRLPAGLAALRGCA